MLSYTYRYNRIIKWFQDHPISKKDFPESEYHHIIPRSCGGSNDKDNIVLLPTRWHYIVHCWLPMFYLEQGKQKEYELMLFAWNRFQNYRNDFRKGLQSIKEDSLLYQKLRNEYIKIVGKHSAISQAGVKNSNYGKHWWKDPNDKTKSLSIKEGDPVPEGWVKGRWVPLTFNPTQKPRKSIILKCHWCGAEKQIDPHTKKIIKRNCKCYSLCYHHQPVKKLIEFFGFVEAGNH